jgi:hypothetical protein
MFAPVALGPALVHPMPAPISAESSRSRQRSAARRRSSVGIPWREDESEYSLFAAGGWLHICETRNSSVLR